MSDFQDKIDEEVKRRESDNFKKQLEALRATHVFICFYSGEPDEPLPFLQMGMGMLLDKPMYVIAPHGLKIPENLQKCAKSVQYVTWGNTEETTAAIQRIVEERGNL